MLINFSVENWMSFRDRVTFSMIASSEKQHRERLPLLNKYKMRILPIAAIYGGNASGKTNLFKALNFAKTLIVKGTRPDSLIPIDPFQLDSRFIDLASHFSFEIFIDGSIYEFSFVITQKNVQEEKLVLISSSSERILFERKNNTVNFDDSLKDSSVILKGTRDNQLCLTNAVSQKLDEQGSIYKWFKPVSDWFKNTLELVAPDSRFEPFEQFLEKKHPLYSIMNDRLYQLDTGIAHIGGQEIPFESLPLPDTLKKKLQEEVKEGSIVRLMGGPTDDRFLINRENNKLIAQKLITYHTKSDGAEAKFDMQQESDGSQRIIDLLPAFLEVSASKSQKVFIIDEVDRSLHTLLTRQLLEGYMKSCSPDSRSQLLFTTHDALLMDQKLLRRDEMWVTERDRDGASKIVSFSEYKDVRKDKDIRKSYLQGRLGGIPRLLLSETEPVCDEKG